MLLKKARPGFYENDMEFLYACYFGKTQVFLLADLKQIEQTASGGRHGDMMIIKKVMNNNVVFVEDDRQQELVLVGKGLGFKMKPGKPVDESKVEKTFSMHNRVERSRLAELLTQVTPENFQLADMIIQYAQTVLGGKLNEVIYLTLTDHIVFAMERVKKGEVFSNPLLWEIKHFYPQEFGVGKYANDYIFEKTGIEMPEAEAGFIALHIAEARSDSSIAHVETTAEILKSAMKIISLSYQIVLDEESLDYGRFVVHMKFCISRLFSNQMLCQDDEMFIKMIQTQYADAYACAEKIGEFI